MIAFSSVKCCLLVASSNSNCPIEFYGIIRLTETLLWAVILMSCTTKPDMALCSFISSGKYFIWDGTASVQNNCRFASIRHCNSTNDTSELKLLARRWFHVYMIKCIYEYIHTYVLEICRGPRLSLRPRPVQGFGMVAQITFEPEAGSGLLRQSKAIWDISGFLGPSFRKEKVVLTWAHLMLRDSRTPETHQTDLTVSGIFVAARSSRV